MKRKLVTLLLALAMLSVCLSAFAVPTVAATPTMPTTIPTGTYSSEKTWVDWSALGLNSTQASIDGDCYKITVQYKQCWSGSGDTLLSQPTAWRGASGVMFYVDGTTNSVAKTDFMLEFLSDGSRPKNATEASWVQLNTKPISGKAVGYYYDGTEWKEFYADASTNGGRFTLNATGATSAWVYIPFTSIWYHGGSNATRSATEDTAYGLDFYTFMTNFEKARIIRAGFESSTVGILFSDLHLIYNDSEEVGNDSTAPLFGTLTASTLEGNASSSVSGNAITVSQMTNNSASSSSQRAWVKGLNVTSLAGATGIRFHVDTSALDSTASLQLRLRLMSSQKVASQTTVYKNGIGNLVSSSGWGNPQFVCGADNSVAYYYDENGNPVALHVQSDVSTNIEGDLFQALPAGYVGDIYIPFDSFWMSGTSYSNKNLQLPFSVAGGKYALTQIAICHAISGTTTSDAVTYSNFEVVYADTAITGASVTLTNNLNVNFYADIQDDATCPTMKFTVGTKTSTVTGEKQEDGTYRFVCENILPQKIGDEITATLTAKVGNYTVTDTVKYSVQQYCESMLAKTDTSETLKKLLVDLLYYGEACQTLAQYNTENLVTANLTQQQKALKSADTTETITASVTKSGVASEDYAWESINLVLESSLSFKFKLTAESTENLTADVTINGRTTTYDAFEGESGYFVLSYSNLCVNELDSDIVLTLKKNGTQIGEAVTVSVAAYIKNFVENPATDAETLNLVRALYAYGQSAEVYSAE